MFVNLDFVVSSAVGGRVAGATVLIGRDYGNGRQRTTDGNGLANFGVEQDNLDWEVAADGFTPAFGNAPIGFADVVLPVTLTPIAVAAPPPAPPAPTPPPAPAPPPPAPAADTYANLNIQVTDAANGAALPGATVLISPDFGNGTQRTTDGNGLANFGVRVGFDVEINVLHDGYRNNDHIIHIYDASDHWYAVALARGSATPAPAPAPPPGVPPAIVLHPGQIGELTPVASTVADDVVVGGYARAAVEHRGGVPSLTAQSFSALDLSGVGLSPASLFSSIIGGLIGLFKGSSGAAEINRLAGILQNTGQFVLQLATTVADITTRSVHSETQGGNIFEHILSNVLGPVINALAAVIRGGSSDLGKLFGPISDSIKKLVGAVRHIYDAWLRPILKAIDTTRQILRVLEAFHFKWAAAADAALGRLEGKLSAPLLLAIRKLNEVSNVVNRIVTLDGALQRVTLIKGLTKHAACVQRAIAAAPMAAPGTYANKLAAVDVTAAGAQLRSDFDELIESDSGPMLEQLVAMDAAFEAELTA